MLDPLGSDRRGPTVADAQRRLPEVGPNRLPEPPRLLAHFGDVLVYILLAAGVLEALLADWVDFAVIPWSPSPERSSSSP